MCMVLFFALMMLIVEKYKKEPTRLIYLVPLIFLLWANMHPSVIIGLFGLFIYVGEKVIEYVKYKIKKTDYSPGKLSRLTLLFATCAVFSLMNPYFYEPLVVPFQLGKMKVLRSLVTELQPLQLGGFYSLISNDVSLILTLFIVTGVLSFIINYRKFQLSFVIFFAAFAFLSFKALRNVSLFIMVASPIIAVNCTRILEMITLKKRHVFVRIIKPALALAIIIYVVVINFADQGDYQIGFGINRNLVPVHGTDFLINNNIEGRVFNTFHYGGYLEFKRYPDEKVLVDGRGFANENMLMEYVNSQSNTEAWNNYQRKYNLDYAIIAYPELNMFPANHTMLSAGSPEQLASISLPDRNWVLVYWDDVCQVYLKRCAKFNKLIDRFEVKYVKPDLPPDYLKGYLLSPEKLLLVTAELKAKNNSYRAYGALGYLYNEMKDFNNAKIQFEKAVAIKKNNDKAYAGLGFAQYNLEFYKEAEKSFRKAVKLDSNDFLNYYYLGLISEKIGKTKQAIAMYEKIMEMKIFLPEAYQHLIKLYSETGKLEKYSDLTKKWEDYQHKNIASLKERFSKALRYTAEGKFEEALDEYEYIMKFDSSNPVVLNNVAFVYYDLNDMAKAVAYNKRCLKINPDFENAHYGLALAYEKTGDYKDAITEWEAYLALSPKGMWAAKAQQHLQALKLQHPDLN
ncbi:MAG: hypothetical protein A2Y62_18295 [Candidatus Fischerbacteria bacterium RBG_13_37_8]|uniref:Uncharacterized protein n=1 Tax=Candidatus Fischerbacteria bacterium RBG_13_37_8 TaxID=1817863 RepID=A0A1F5VP38_9BACT|nr:MAG: hypothetical protein A2Y62_18295 [Candidatus Fischerbacteria bacterium RBG_13_37_8]